jgi:hypothetical protein
MPSGQLPKSLASSSLYDASPHTIVGSPRDRHVIEVAQGETGGDMNSPHLNFTAIMILALAPRKALKPRTFS